MGLKACVPLEYKFTHRRGKAYRKSYPLLGPRYIFVAGCPEFPWEARWKVHLITGTVMHDGEPAEFTDKTVKKLDRISESTYTINSTAVQHRSYVPGQAVILRTGALEGHAARVVEVEDGGLLVLVDLLGSAQAVRVDWDAVEHE
jgi:transcription antitermination factor NusG